MPHHTPLISTIVMGLVLAFILGALANRLRVSPLVGYLLAGVLVGPFGNAAAPDVLQAANLAAARCLIVAIPNAFEGGQVVEQARAINPMLPILARAHSQEEVAHLENHGATSVIMGEQEIAKAMLAAIALDSALVRRPRRLGR